MFTVKLPFALTCTLRVLVLMLFCCNFAVAQDKPYVILISFDGFRHDYVSTFKPPNFTKFVNAGAAAEALIPSFPSKTFPNHYTLITGMYPGHHGLVDNEFYDPRQEKVYGMKRAEAVRDPSFYGGLPLWQLAQRNGLKTASYFWVGSETAIQGSYPSYYFPYDEQVPNESRIDQAIAWLQLPEADRPRLITLYFSLVDSEGHNTGTESVYLKNTVLKADSLLGYLNERLKAVALPVNIVIVSDHGMLQLKQEVDTYITLARITNLKSLTTRFINAGTQVHVYTHRVDSVYQALMAKATRYNFKVLRPGDFPSSWHYNNPRTGDLLLVADKGFYFQVADRNFGKVKYPVFGVHGYDPYRVSEMHGIFYAKGPNIKAGARIPAVENVHVYPFVAALLGLTPPPDIDGKLSVVEPMLMK